MRYSLGSTKGIPIPLYIRDYAIVIHSKKNWLKLSPQFWLYFSPNFHSGHKPRNSFGGLPRILPCCVHGLQQNSLLPVSSAAGISSPGIPGIRHSKRRQGQGPWEALRGPVLCSCLLALYFHEQLLHSSDFLPICLEKNIPAFHMLVFLLMSQSLFQV